MPATKGTRWAARAMAYDPIASPIAAYVMVGLLIVFLAVVTVGMWYVGQDASRATAAAQSTSGGGGDRGT
jgi:hypothetical protein